MRLVIIGLLLSAAAFAQYPIPGSSGGGGGGGGCTAGTGITCVGSTISVDTAVIQSRATAQSGASTYCRSTTGNDTYTCALTPTLTAYTSGGCVVLFADTANTLAATLNVDALGAVSILTRTGGALSTGDVPAKPITLCHDGTNYIIQGDGGGSGGSGTVTDVTCGTGLTGGVINVSGTCAIDTAVVPEKAAANTFAELQTLQKGANIAWSTALASAGDIRYNGGDIQYRDGSGSITLMKNPFTTRGDMLIQGASGPTRLAAGTSGYFLMANGPGADPSYQVPNASQVTNAFDKSTTNSLGANYFDMTEQAAPSAPGVNVARVYAKDDAGTTKVCYQDSAAVETCVGAGGGGSPGGSGTELQYRSGASTFGGLENSSRPNAGELLLSTTPANSGTRQVFGLGSALTRGSANGTYFGINSGSGFTGTFARFELNGSARFNFASTGAFTATTSVTAATFVVTASAADFSDNSAVRISNQSSGASAGLRIYGSTGTAAANFLALRGTNGGTATDQLRINGDSKCVMIGQTAETTSETCSVLVKNDLAATGSTLLKVALGAADSATTVILNNEGTIKSGGYQSSDGSVGVTGSTCTAWKNGLCVTL